MFQGGIVLFQLVDTYGPSGTSLLIIACFETIVVAWVYGKSCHSVSHNVCLINDLLTCFIGASITVQIQSYAELGNCSTYWSETSNSICCF